MPLTPEQWLARELPPEDLLLGAIFSTSTRVIFAADTGLGKTMLAMAWAFAMALGRDFMHWRAHRPARVLFIDGEMPRDLMKERVAQACGWFGVDAPREGLFILSREDFEDMPPLDTEEGAAWIIEIIEALGGVDFIFFDNFMSLCVSDLRDEEGWQLLKPFVGELTRRRIGQLWVNHVGHADKSRGYGTKTREWQMDVVMVGEKVEAPGADVAMQLSFPKARRRKPESRADFEPVKLELREGQWFGGGTDAASPSSGARPPCLSDKGKIFVQAVEKALKYKGERPPDHPETRSVTAAVKLDTVRAYWRQLIGWEEADEREKNQSRWEWKRAQENAIGASAVKRWGDFLWLP